MTDPQTGPDPAGGWRVFDSAVGRWVLDQAELESLPAAAVDALSLGAESMSLIRLAGMEGATWSEIDPVMRRIYRERNESLPSRERSVKLVADAVMRAVVAGEMLPRIGATRLWKLAWVQAGSTPSSKPMWPDLAWFLAVGSCWDEMTAGECLTEGLPWIGEHDVPTDADVEQAVLLRCYELLAVGGVRSGARQEGSAGT